VAAAADAAVETAEALHVQASLARVMEVKSVSARADAVSARADASTDV